MVPVLKGELGLLPLTPARLIIEIDISVPTRQAITCDSHEPRRGEARGEEGRRGAGRRGEGRHENRLPGGYVPCS